MTSNQHNTNQVISPKSSKQLLMLSLFTIGVPLTLVILVVFATKAYNRAEEQKALVAKTVAQRIQKIGTIRIQQENRVRTLQSGEDVFKAQCSACHATGVAGAPKFADATAWAPRIKTGLDALVLSSIKGKGAMGAQGGGAFQDIEIARAMVYMANAAGAKFEAPEPEKPAEEPSN